jgi:hypothetical protein
MRDNRIGFVVRYKNGLVAHIWISRSDLRTGDHVVRTIVRERQDAGEIPKDEIESVRRAPE